MKVEVCNNSDQLVVTLSGDLIKESAQRVLDELTVALASSDFRSVRMDFGAVDQFDSTVLAVILGVIQTISSRPLFIANARAELHSPLKVASENGLFTIVAK